MEAEGVADPTPLAEEGIAVVAPQNIATRMGTLHQKVILTAIAQSPQGLQPRMPIGIQELEKLMHLYIATISRQTIGLI